MSDLFDYWMAHQDDSRAALALIETQAKEIEEIRALLRDTRPYVAGLGLRDAAGDVGARIDAFLALDKHDDAPHDDLTAELASVHRMWDEDTAKLIATRARLAAAEALLRQVRPTRPMTRLMDDIGAFLTASDPNA